MSETYERELRFLNESGYERSVIVHNNAHPQHLELGVRQRYPGDYDTMWTGYIPKETLIKLRDEIDKKLREWDGPIQQLSEQGV